jgi:hypothetical protein
MIDKRLITRQQLREALKDHSAWPEEAADAIFAASLSLDEGPSQEFLADFHDDAIAILRAIVHADKEWTAAKIDVATQPHPMAQLVEARGRRPARTDREYPRSPRISRIARAGAVSTNRPRARSRPARMGTTGVSGESDRLTRGAALVLTPPASRRSSSGVSR